MSEYLPVPVDVARAISENYSKSMVVILCYDDVHEVTHTTSYGREAFDKENAAAAAVLCTKAVGGDLSRKQEYEDFHNNYDAAKLRTAQEIFIRIWRHQGITAVDLQQIERWLRPEEFFGEAEVSFRNQN